MPDNRGVAYMGTGKVEVQDIDYPTFELKDGPGVNPANVGRPTSAAHSPTPRSSRSSRRTSAAPTSTWSAAARPLPRA
jgi:hypothetical protein